jgi:hypothetical protein
MRRHWEESSSGGRLACRVVRTVGNALYLGAQGGIAWRALAVQRAPISARFLAQRAQSASSASRKLLLKNKNGSCATRMLLLEKSYRRLSDRFAASKNQASIDTNFNRCVSGFARTRWRWKFPQTPCHTQFADLRRRGGEILRSNSL